MYKRNQPNVPKISYLLVRNYWKYREKPLKINTKYATRNLLKITLIQDFASIILRLVMVF